ncbi:hypothetical protein HY489_02180 [Candidatus Woesearchaeota archaeon]|nr:hypothetical protein [Candidatus Woesearchaeota archaeon]
MKRRWKYSREAQNRRYCEACEKRLNKKEAVLCIRCLRKALLLDGPEFDYLFKEENNESD